MGEKKTLSTRIVFTLLSILPLLLALPAPFLSMWDFYINAPIYGQKWLTVAIYPLAGVSGDVEEVNIVNHYVGLGPIGNEEIPEIIYLPYFYAAYITLAAITAISLQLKRKKPTLLLLLSGVILVASVYGYVYLWLYNYTHTIMPGAAFKIEPFDPPFIGEHRVANFIIRSYPGPSLILLTISAVIGILFTRRLKL